MKKQRVRCALVFLRVAVMTLVVALAAWWLGHESIVRARGAGRTAHGGRTVAVDEAHGNAGAFGTLKSFADLLTLDGYHVVPFSQPFGTAPLASIDVLVVAGAAGAPAASIGRGSAATIGDRECDVVREWVRGGGSLLIVAGPPSSVDPGERLALRFGVEFGRGWVFDRTSAGITTALEFSRANGLLGDHAILGGRGGALSISRVRTAGGQSLGVPGGAAMLLKLGATAREALTRDDLESEDFAARQERDIAGSFSMPAAGRAAAIALSYAKGRVVMFGDADLLSSGLRTRDVDNRQFAVNVVRWLARQL